MTQCRFCLLQNPGDEERCSRCGKRLSGDITFDGLAVAGATVLAPRRRSATSSGTAEIPQNLRRPRTAVAEPVRQSSLFPGEFSSNVIPFESKRPAEPPTAKPEVLQDMAHGPAAKRLNAAKPTVRKQGVNRSTSDTQGSLDLECLSPAPQTPRTLKTTVEAQIYCDALVAAPMHRSVAAFLDSAMIAIGYGIFVAIFQALGGTVQIDRLDIVTLLGALILITLFYGFLFALAGRETPGQRWTDLRLINFDGLPPDGTSRFLRFTGCWLSFSACGVGVLWSLMDEENLTWHDHMSKTFPTLREVDTSFFRERAR